MSREARIATWLFLLVAFGVILHVLEGILMPFVVGMAIAYFVDPLADRLEDWGCSRAAATVIIAGGFFAVLVGLILLLIPLLESQIVALAVLIPDVVALIRKHLEPVLEQIQANVTPETIASVGDALGNYAGTITGWIQGVLSGIWTGGMAVFRVLSLVVITPIVAFYLLLEWDRIIARLDDLLPRRQAPVVREQLRLIDATISGFVRGQATVCLVLAAYYGLALTIVGLKVGLIVGIGAGAISFIPYVGASVGILTGVGIALAQFDAWQPVAAVAAVFVVGQLLESYVLTPRLVGGRVGLHDLWIIFALMAGGALFGFTGVLLAIPVAAVIGVLIRFAVKKYLDSPLYCGNGGDG